MAFLLKETFKFPKDNFKSMKYQPYELKPSFSMYRVYEWYQHWNGMVYVSFSGGLDSTVLAYLVCEAYRKYHLEGKLPLVFVNTVRFMIQGLGYSKLAVLAGVSEMVARSVVGFFLVPIYGYTAACFASPVAWIAADLFLIPAYRHVLKSLAVLFGQREA